jgi:hypothetical protein
MHLSLSLSLFLSHSVPLQFDRALQSLPITQHDRLWPPYIAFVRRTGVADTATRIYRRYLKVLRTPRTACVYPCVNRGVRLSMCLSVCTLVV